VKKLITILLGVLLVLLVLFELGLGQAGLDLNDPAGRFAILELRLPRVLSAIAVALATASATALLQLRLRIQIAEPALFGISSFAALGTIAALLLGFPFGSLAAWLLAAVATILALVPLGLIAGKFETGVSRNQISARANLPLIGIAIGALGTAFVGLASGMLPDARLRSVALWAFGTLSLQNLWSSLITLLLAAALVVVMAVLAPRLEKLALGPALLRGLGLSSGQLGLLALVLVGLLSATAAYSTGSIAFVGLLSVSLARMIYGSRLLPLALGSSLLAAVVLVGCDLLTRLIAPPYEFPIGLFTAALGAPILIWVVMRKSNA
jgi:iron complex transport system permease protein